MVPSAGCPTAVSLWVPALRACCLGGGGMVSGCYDAEGVIDTCLSPHMSLLRQGPVHVSTCGLQRSKEQVPHRVVAAQPSSLAVRHLRGLTCTSLSPNRSLLFTPSKLQILHKGELFSCHLQHLALLKSVLFDELCCYYVCGHNTEMA